MPYFAKNRELFRALRVVWAISAVVFFAVFLFLFLAKNEVILANSPVCIWQKEGRSCVFCGMTRAFVEIKSGNFSQAKILNRFSVVLFGMMAFNQIIFLIFVLKCLKMRRK